jgi:NADPH:quinone reductase-like Zn-dependent oxidoreductase
VRAIRYHEYGTVDVLREEDVSAPAPGPGEVLVRVEATSFNPVDDHIRLGVLAEAIPTRLPITPGLDVAGTVAGVGDGVDGLQVGDAVIAMLPLDAHGGAAEYAVMAADLVARAPLSVALADAAALPLAGLAARQAIVELADVTPGQTVLVNGAGGAVGSLAVQLAHDAGAHVTAVDQPEHHERLRALGAEAVVDPLDLDAGPEAVGGPFDVMVNHVRLGPSELPGLTRYVADGGIAVSSAGPIPHDEARSVRTASVWVAPDGAHLADLVARLDEGRLRLHILDRRTLSELPEVHRAAGEGRLTGKTVIVLR